jgi:prephenate dehydrogenase
LNPLLTDVGSVKEPICQALSNVSQFIGSHPIAGSHRQGFEAADPSLFEGRMCVLTPVLDTLDSQLARLTRFWQALGMQTIQMSPVAHDASLAMTSHLPHVVAAALAMTLTDENRPFIGSGFRDTTRVAAGGADLWTDILLNNAGHVIEGIDAMQRMLQSFREALRTEDSRLIRELLAQGSLIRASLEQQQQGLDQNSADA